MVMAMRIDQFIKVPPGEPLSDRREVKVEVEQIELFPIMMVRSQVTLYIYLVT